MDGKNDQEDFVALLIKWCLRQKADLEKEKTGKINGN